MEEAKEINKELEIKENVRTTYAKVAVTDTESGSFGISASCCGTSPAKGADYSKQLGYSDQELNSVPVGANMGLGCGNPVAISGLKAGEFVLDLGSGGGFDCFLAARKVGDTGKVIGVDMTAEMISKARLNAQKGGYKNVEFRLGEIEHLPVENNSIDAIISNCVINLSTNKQQVFKEAARVLKEGGRLIISDIVATAPIPENIKNDLALYSGCMAGATPIEELKNALKAVGFESINIQVKEESRSFIKGWASDRGVENYVASATIEAYRPTLELKETNKLSDSTTTVSVGVSYGSIFSTEAKQPSSAMKILFLCTGNSCRSQMAEGYAKHLGKDFLEVKSAGLVAHGINPKAIQVMKEDGLDISCQQSTKLAPDMLQWADLIITLCGHADESCPAIPRGKEKRHVPFSDPAKATGNEEEILNQFREVRNEIKKSVETLIEEHKNVQRLII